MGGIGEQPDIFEIPESMKDKSFIFPNDTSLPLV